MLSDLLATAVGHLAAIREAVAAWSVGPVGPDTPVTRAQARQLLHCSWEQVDGALARCAPVTMGDPVWRWAEVWDAAQLLSEGYSIRRDRRAAVARQPRDVV